MTCGYKGNHAKPSVMKFSDWLKSSGLTQKEFAERIGVTQSAISHLRNNRKRPSFELMVKIEKATKGKVKLNDWRETESFRQVAAE
jgi:transcriptional regulator with XRE-family HTH domain